MVKTVLAVQRFALAAVPAVLRRIPSSGAIWPVSEDAQRARKGPPSRAAGFRACQHVLAPYLQPLLLHLPPAAFSHHVFTLEAEGG